MGAGLSGLTAAEMLAEAGLRVAVVEARERVGGRLLTVDATASSGGGDSGGETSPAVPVDLGGTWHWADQTRVAALAERLGVASVAQHAQGLDLAEAAGAPPERAQFPQPPAPARTFAGGAQQLCLRLCERLGEGLREGLGEATVLTGRTVEGLALDGEAGLVRAEVAGGGPGATTMAARFAVVAVPPRWLAARVRFDPPLPERLAAVLAATPTWMAGALKVVVVYDRPFWRSDGLSGTALSEAGPLAEVHDASLAAGGAFALWGLVATGSPVRARPPLDRHAALIEHLVRLFGPQARSALAYRERSWPDDPATADPGAEADAEAVSHPAPSYGHPLFGQPLWRRRLYLAGSETANVGGGHMEGAVRAGQRAAWLVLAAYASSSEAMNSTQSG